MKKIKKLIASCVILSLLGGTSSVCFGRNWYTGETVAVAFVSGAAVGAAISLTVTLGVSYKDQVKAWFTGPFKNFFTQTIPNAFTPKKAVAGNI